MHVEPTFSLQNNNKLWHTPWISVLYVILT